jgi:molybdenum cofactor guanylyltransferase
MVTNKKRSNVNGLILAGGRARRMGGQDKGLILLDGKQMIEHCIARLLPQVGQVFISANKNIEQYDRYGFSVLEDKFGHFEGPLAGLLRAFEYSKDTPVLVVPCDAPFLSTELARRLLESYEETKTSAVIPHDGDRLQPLFGLYAPDVVSSLTEYLTSGQRKVETWVTSLPHAVVDFSNEHESFMNINTESDLQAAQSILHPAMEEGARHAE